MEPVALLLGDNLKVHFAGTEQIDFGLIAHAAGVKYFLFSCFPFISRQFGIKGYPVTVKTVFPPKELETRGKHVIMDNGLFTLMFGAHKAPRDLAFITAWQDALVAFVKDNNVTATCVEVDCQKILGVKEAWRLREKLRHDLPDNRQINVFHAEDGKKGLDSLVDFSEYIAISVPELRIRNRRGYAGEVFRLANYIKDRKPDIDIHLLGCTEPGLLRRCSFCTTADSTTWQSCNRWGNILGRHVSQIDKGLLEQAIPHVLAMYEKCGIAPTETRNRYYARYYASAHIHKQYYAQLSGSQE